ncbi:MAG: cache domain-containing protein, partial [Sphaerochaetaceae bacterium]|nr:cache domain-containing protein [Sphaerochaetaceae bacterium]
MKKLHKGLLLAGALLLLVILLSLTSLLMLRKADQLVSEDARDMLNEIATQLEMRLQSAIASEIASLEFQAHFISRYENIQDPRVMHILREEVDAASFIRLGVILPDGNSVNTDGYVVNLAHREYFKKAMAGIPNISDVLRHTQDPDELIMAIAVPIRRGEEVVGVLRGARFVDEYARLLQITTYGSVGYASVVKRTGEVVLANSSDKGDVLATSVPYVALPEYSEDPSLRA